jgi:hypothetical protein
MTNLHILLEDRLYSQAGPDNSHGRSAKYAGDVNELGFHGHLFFGLGDYWLHGSSSRGGLWPPLFRSWFAGTSRLLSWFQHDFFNGGGWTEAPLSCSPHRVLVLFTPPICGVG